MSMNQLLATFITAHQKGATNTAHEAAKLIAKHTKKHPFSACIATHVEIKALKEYGVNL